MSQSANRNQAGPSSRNQAGPSSRSSDEEIRAVVAASAVYDARAERRNVVAVEGLLSLGQNAITEASLASALNFVEAPPRTPPPTIRVAAAPSPETRRRIESEASRLRQIGGSSARPSNPRLPNVSTAISDDVYDMYTTGRGWPERMMWEIGGDLVATKPISHDGRPDDQPSSSDDERGDSIIGPQGVLARLAHRRERADYLSRIAVALLALQQEKADRGDVIIPAGIVIRHEVWKGSTFQTSRKHMTGWKKLIDEHRRFNRELTAEEVRYELTFDHIVLMKPPFRSAIEGETARWGRDMRNVPTVYGRSMERDEGNVGASLPLAYPEVPDPLASEEEEEDDADHLYNHSNGGAPDMGLPNVDRDEDDW